MGYTRRQPGDPLTRSYDPRMPSVRSRAVRLPALAVLAVAAGGLLVAVVVDGRLGGLLIGLALLLAAGLRLVLPPPHAGWLAVRTRGLDATLLLVVGFALVVLANTVPDA
jgi:hypothetical protein